MSEERKILIKEANELGLEFQSNIPTEKLKVLINEHPESANKTSETVGQKPTIELSDNATSTEDKAAIEAELEDEDGNEPEVAVVKKLSLRKRIANAKQEALKTSIVTITNKDNRENDFMTTVYLAFENQYFGLSREVPLDIPVQLENSLISIAEATKMTLHKDEIINGRRTGNKTAVRVKKFAISYTKPIE